MGKYPCTRFRGYSFGQYYHQFYLTFHHQIHFVKLLRYGDDILLTNETDDGFDFSINSLNSMHPNIKSTHEKEQYGCINLLDLTITRCNNRFQTPIIIRKRKSTVDSIYIRRKYCHFFSTKADI